MGLDPNVPGIPKIVLVYPPHHDQIDIRCQALSMQQAHKAVPVTLSLNLGVTSKLSGTIPHKLARQRNSANTVVGHPSGKLEVGAEIVNGEIIGAKLIRTARWLMGGYVNDTQDHAWIEH
jgi:2-methylaconitate cis-trans-isomerase PrpF